MSNAAKKALALEETCASACVVAINQLYENHWLVWEPETIWIEADKAGIDIPVGNRGQLMAARNLVTSARYWYDAHAFAATCIAFNNEEALHMGIESAPVAYINWAVHEAKLIYEIFLRATTVPDLDREPVKYAAVQLNLEGFVFAPPLLAFAQRELNKLCAADCADLRNTVQKGWADAPKGKDLDEAAFPETAAGVQLARLAALQRYFDKREESRLKQLAALQTK
jgi:hypothetical protein